MSESLSESAIRLGAVGSSMCVASGELGRIAVPGALGIAPSLADGRGPVNDVRRAPPLPVAVWREVTVALDWELSRRALKGRGVVGVLSRVAIALAEGSERARASRVALGVIDLPVALPLRLGESGGESGRLSEDEEDERESACEAECEGVIESPALEPWSLKATHVKLDVSFLSCGAQCPGQAYKAGAGRAPGRLGRFD